ncbi:MAG: hypothetical protein A3F12_05150 [Gammaproteobacteria bacterium RIFCSPHIGHO2_12_FULL_38_14]|nr:MAG: hypothetical protein A3F12_05150 [Gammaproteobacteria bacterium RIFCSPHIGHO2_12_FULL_38_14]
MFKKLLVSSIILAASSTVAFAAGGSYKGEKDYKGEMMPCPTYTYTAGPYIGLSVGLRTNYSGSPTVFKGLDGNLSLGYGAMVTPSFYLAGEIFGIATGNIKDLQYTSGTTNYSAKSNWSYGASILPGYMITDYVLGYLRAGVIATRFNQQSVTKTGGQLGLGGQTSLTPNWDLRGEYVFTQYRTVGSIGRVASDQVNLGLVYKFV